MKYTVVTGPAMEPVSLAEAKAHCRIDVADSDGLVAGYILAARRWVEDICGIVLITQTIDAYYDGFCARLVLPRAVAASVTSVTYTDSNGSTQTLSASYYTLNNRDRVNAVELADGYSWPDTYAVSNSVTVRYVAGTSLSAVPEPIRQAILMLVGFWHENRETVNIGNITTALPFAVDALLAPYRVYY